jgi:hypothetical protein
MPLGYPSLAAAKLGGRFRLALHWVVAEEAEANQRRSRKWPYRRPER